MSDQHIVNTIACLFPHWQSQHTSMNVELCGLNTLVLHHKVLGGKEFGKLRFDFVADGHCSVAYGPIIQKKRVVRPSYMPVWEVVQSGSSANLRLDSLSAGFKFFLLEAASSVPYGFPVSLSTCPLFLASSEASLR